MRETPSGIFCDHLRETSTSAHLISCCLTDGGSISFLRQKARAQKARKLGLSGLFASFPYINFALLKRRNYDKIQVQTVAFHRGKKSGLMHVVAEGGGGKWTPFCRRMIVRIQRSHFLREVRLKAYPVCAAVKRKGHLGLQREKTQGQRILRRNQDSR